MTKVAMRVFPMCATARRHRVTSASLAVGREEA